MFKYPRQAYREGVCDGSQGREYKNPYHPVTEPYKFQAYNSGYKKYYIDTYTKRVTQNPRTFIQLMLF